MTAGVADPDAGLDEAAASQGPPVSAAALSAQGPSGEDTPEAGQGRSPFLTLDGFTGPLERLLTLARAQRVDLARLSLTALIEQLATALQHASSATPLGEKGDWVVMAAWLVQLRSLLLLPAEAPARQAAEVDAAQLRVRLLNLRAMQALAGWLQQRPQLGHDVFARGHPPSRAQSPEVFGVSIETAPVLDVIEFLWASLALFDDDLPNDETTVRYQPRGRDLHAIPEARMRILRLLAVTPDGRNLDTLLPEAIDAADAEIQSTLRRRSAWTSTFIASLELARQGEVALAQEAFLSPIHVRITSTDQSHRDADRDSPTC